MNVDYYAQIEDYLDRKLSAEEVAAFEAAMSDDAVLQATVDKYQTLRITLERQARQEARKSILEAREIVESRPAIIRNVGPRRAMAIAASVVIVVVAGAAIIANTTFSREQLAAAYYQFPDDIYTNQSGSRADSVVTAILKLWSEGSHESAISAGEQYITLEPGDMSLKYLVAHMMYESGKFAKANELFQQLAGADSRYRADAEFMQALCDLRMDMEEEAIAQLEVISQDVDHMMSDESEALLKKLRSPVRVLSFD